MRGRGGGWTRGVRPCGSAEHTAPMEAEVDAPDASTRSTGRQVMWSSDGGRDGGRVWN